MEFVYEDKDGSERHFVFPDGIRVPTNDGLETCVSCLDVSSYNRAYTDEETGHDNGIALIPSSNCFEWECGHCGARHAPVRSPVVGVTYTHTGHLHDRHH